MLRRSSLLAASQMTGGGQPDTPSKDEWDYYTVIPEEDCEVQMIPFSGSNDFWGDMVFECLPFSYRINGENWIEVSLGFTQDNFIIIPVKANDKLQVKSYGKDFKFGSYISDETSLNVIPSVKFKVCGTPMSIVYGDDFKNNNFVPANILQSFLLGTDVTEILNPETFLPYTELDIHAYNSLFSHCTELINAPVLPATVLAEGCYMYMFESCSKINYIEMLATDISATDCLSNWVKGVSSTGTFVKHPEATWDVRGASGVPEGWTIKFDGEEENPYAFSFNIEVAKGASWTANNEQLIQIKKMFSIVTNFLGMEGGEFTSDNVPQEFDLRINGVRNFNIMYNTIRNENDVIDIYIILSDGDGTWFGVQSLSWKNPIVKSFMIISSL